MSDPVQISIITSIASVVAAILSFLAVIFVKKTHKLVNSRMDELLKAAKILSRQEGVDQEKADEKKRKELP